MSWFKPKREYIKTIVSRHSIKHVVINHEYDPVGRLNSDRFEIFTMSYGNKIEPFYGTLIELGEFLR
jgi:hypothetical protein